MSALLKLFVFILLASASTVYGTSCQTFAGLNEQEYRKELDQIDAIFLGEVIAIGAITNLFSDGNDRYQVLTVKVLRTWRGVIEPEINVRYAPITGPAEAEYLRSTSPKMFYATKRSDGFLGVGYCSFQFLFDDKRMKSVLGEGTVVEQPAAVEPEANSEPWWVRLWNWLVSFF